MSKQEKYFIINSAEYTHIRNGLYAIKIFHLDHKDIFSSSIVEQIEKAIKDIESGIDRIFQEEKRIEIRRFDHYKQVHDENKFISVWSIYHIDNLYDEHDYKDLHSNENGDLEIVYERGNTNNKVKVLGKRWVDLYRAADECIRRENSHYIFIEDFKIISTPTGHMLSVQTGS